MVALQADGPVESACDALPPRLGSAGAFVWRQDMHILFAGGAGYLPEFSGGVQSSTDHLVRQSIQRGHKASVLAALFGSSPFGLLTRARLKLSPNPGVVDRSVGYDVMRSWAPWDAVGHAVEKFKPDVALVQCHKAVRVGRALDRHRIPLVVYLRNVEFEELEGDPRELPTARFIANSEFTARTYNDAFGIESTVIPPTIDKKKYRFQTSREFVTLINLYPEKGFDLAIKIAEQCPDIPFLFVESWSLAPAELNRVLAALAPLSNVTFQKRTDDMGTVYGRTKILLAPSKWQEAWGRVASEAHCSGIPVIGSDRGGLPEAIGPGGTILDYDAPLQDWCAAVRDLWNDDAAYQRKSAAAESYSDRPLLDTEDQVTQFLAVMEAASVHAGSSTP